MADTLRNTRLLLRHTGITDLEIQAVIDGAVDVLRVADAKLIVQEYKDWRLDDPHDYADNSRPHRSMEWYIEEARAPERKQLNATVLLAQLAMAPWRQDPRATPYYDLFVVGEDLYYNDANFVLGLSQRGAGTVISPWRLRSEEPDVKKECLKTLTMQKIGQVFGLLPYERMERVDYTSGRHCANVCVMRSGLRVPDDWISYSKDRKNNKRAFCETCSEDLQDYFRQPGTQLMSARCR